LNEIKTSYIHPALEFFCNGLVQEENTNFFGIVLFKTSQTSPMANCCTTYGPFSAQKFIKKIDELELTSGRGEQCANLIEGLATALVCFHDLEKRRENEISAQKHCVLISNSPPYTMPVTECYEYEGKNLEQLAALFVEKNINLSVISPRKIPILYEIFEKSGGDLGLTAKNYSKDPRHLVLLKGFSLKELIHVRFYRFNLIF
jgi:mediator of RNA polymerase II transcription subunit 25